MALDFELSPEHEAVRELARRFCQQEIAPLVREAEESETFPRAMFRKWASWACSASLPEADGGSGMDKIADCIIRED